MTLQPGCRLAVASHFHLVADWPRRLQIGAGVEEANGSFFPCSPWRPPTPDELALLVQSTEERVPPEEREGCVCLFQLPGHLRAEWWKRLEQGADLLGTGPLPGFEAFVSQVADFLAFKDLPLPDGAHCDVVLSDPRQRFVSWSPPEGAPRLWGGINLGDEDTSLVLVNLSYGQMRAELHRRCPDQPAPATAGELARRFLTSCSDYPPVRLILAPGEGFRLPPGGLIVGEDREGKQEPDVMLLITLASRRT
jgi:hypothetical protein